MSSSENVEMIENPYPKDSIWIGKRHDDPTNILRYALIVGESTYGEDTDDPQWIRYFIDKKVIATNDELRREGKQKEKPDTTFCRLRWFMTDPGMRAGLSYVKLFERASSDQLQAWFDQFAFTNYVVVPVGATNKSKVTDPQLALARVPFLRTLEKIRPKAAWVLGKRQTDDPENTLGILKNFGVEERNIEVMIPHPAFISTVEGLKSWERFLDIMRRLNA
jgi:hypothetical protein